MFFMKKKNRRDALAMRAGEYLMEQLPVDMTWLQRAARFLTPRRVKQIAIAAVGGSALLALIRQVGRDWLFRAAVASELRKQLEPIHRQLDELAEQNEELRKQNEELKEQLAH